MLRHTAAGMFCVALVLSLSACATLFTGTRDTITFNSSPRGALVIIDGIDVGRTPVTVPVKRSLGDRVVTLRMEGFADRTFVLPKEFNLVSVLNLYNLFGWGVDAASGALFKYGQRGYELELERRVALAEQLEVEAVYLLDEVHRDRAGALLPPDVPGGVALVDPAMQHVLVVRRD